MNATAGIMGYRIRGEGGKMLGLGEHLLDVGG